jgi:hypothetical protein
MPIRKSRMAVVSPGAEKGGGFRNYGMEDKAWSRRTEVFISLPFREADNRSERGVT